MVRELQYPGGKAHGGTARRLKRRHIAALRPESTEVSPKVDGGTDGQLLPYTQIHESRKVACKAVVREARCRWLLKVTKLPLHR